MGVKPENIGQWGESKYISLFPPTLSGPETMIIWAESFYKERENYVNQKKNICVIQTLSLFYEIYLNPLFTAS